LSKREHQHRALDRCGELMRLLPAVKNQHDLANLPGQMSISPREQARQAASGAASSVFATAQI
jgi:hypothetical protein